LPQRRRPGEVERGACVPVGHVFGWVVDDVFADPLVAAAAEVDDRGRPREVAVVAVMIGERVALHLEGKLRETLVVAHGRTVPAYGARANIGLSAGSGGSGEHAARELAERLDRDDEILLGGVLL